MHTESAAIFLFTEKAVWNYKWVIWQIIIWFSAAESLFSNVLHNLCEGCERAWASQFTRLGPALVFPHQTSFHTPISLLFPTIDPAWYASDFDYPGWSLSDLTDQCFSPPVAFWGDAYQLCSYMHLTTLLADSDSVSDHLPDAHTLPQTTPPL